MDISTISAQFIKGVGPERLKLLNRLGISSVKDCLFYFPRRYEDRSNLRPISQLVPDVAQTIKGKVKAMSVFRTRKGSTICQVAVTDGTGTLYCLWFNQPYMRKNFNAGDEIIVYGKVQKSNKLQIIQPEYELIREEDDAGDTVHTGRIVPIYPLAQGVNQRRLRSIIKNAVGQYSSGVQETLPTNIRARHRLLGLRPAVENIHFPVNERQMDEARRRIVFDEFFILQLALALRRHKMKHDPKGKAFDTEHSLLDEFFNVLGFELTSAQKKAIEDIKNDMSSKKPMHRLIQGEVGSGKTVVSAYALLVAVANSRQAAIMVPTEILARQHYITLSGIVSSLGVRTALLINGMAKDEKEASRKLISSGEADIIVGTHALIQESVDFKDLGVVVIDEQHKFGVEQRTLLKSKTDNASMLVMTATPIPRTMAMTLYGDMDVSVINELPHGKRDVQTFWMDPSQLNEVYDFVKEQLKEKHQAYIVYPVIDESEALGSSGAQKMYENLKSEVFKGHRLGLMHGRLNEEENRRMMTEFKKGAIDILVATTIVEVGIDVPNATVMVVENAERFGLSQLHQLRGRIGRGKHRSYCILVSDAKTEEAKERLEVISTTDDGFKIAEEDLNIRGPGELFGKRQHGTPELKLGNLVSDIGILEDARKEAFALVAEDPGLRDERLAKIRQVLVESYKDKFHLGLMG